MLFSYIYIYSKRVIFEVKKCCFHIYIQKKGNGVVRPRGDRTKVFQADFGSLEEMHLILWLSRNRQSEAQVFLCLSGLQSLKSTTEGSLQTLKSALRGVTSHFEMFTSDFDICIYF